MISFKVDFRSGSLEEEYVRDGADERGRNVNGLGGQIRPIRLLTNIVSDVP